ncbi:MAG TPA: mucin desulfatase [Lentisphaeria bacterium]|nr:MAG: mucin desulfatase [Lentisphaerae bacterium GWF2_49_21]HBC87932.1 mucin desulfatase [Lentisphaeria bacterium]
MSSKKEYNLKSICRNFQLTGDFLRAAPYGSGHINDTFEAIFNQGGIKVRYIVQRINHDIFKDPVALMDNVHRVTSHIHRKLSDSGDTTRRALSLIDAVDGKSFFKDNEGNFWRTYIFVENTKSYNIIETADQAYQAAKAFGDFQKYLVDIPGGRLNETIPNFHNTPKRFEAFEKALAADSCNRAKSAEKEIAFALKKKEMACTLLRLCGEGKIPERITHNDTKLNNVLLDEKTGEAVCVIDLDTVMPGLALYDFGDLVRTSTSPAAEDEKDLSKVKMQMHMFEALAKGYLSASSSFLTKTEIEYLPFSGKLITFEIGIRFLTDYLSGDTYFKIHRERHNLDRCRTQFKLVESIESQEDKMQEQIKNI